MFQQELCKLFYLILLKKKKRTKFEFRYSLLDPSECGKTTLLRCIVGRLQLKNRGEITVLGQRPGSRGHQVPA
jgi:ABC-type Fe3+/spermidine/putrescine transport system ATPase subunit